MRSPLSFMCLLIIVWYGTNALPVQHDKPIEQNQEDKEQLEHKDYYRYLREVVDALESDAEFRQRLEKADENEVKSGKIAEHLDFVHHNVRTQLDEIKRREMERLKHLATLQYELTNNLNSDKEKEHHAHLDHKNPHTFEIEDLKKLIKKTSDDLEETDRQRREEFKAYEMQKEYNKHQKLDHMDENEKKVFQNKLEEEEKAKKKHEPLRHPGSKQQYEEVWQKQDHMDQVFDHRAFFMMHDVDGNGVWDANEVKALFISELDKMYGPNGPNKDLHERAEEMERMREHVFNESDLNRDGLIDFNEFVQQTKNSDFQNDQGWQPIDENEIYTQAEYQEYARKKLEELTYLQQRGLVDSYGTYKPGTHEQVRQALHEQQQMAYHQQQMQNQYYHGQVPQSHGQAPPVQGQVPPVQGQVPPVHGQVPPVQGQIPPVHGQVPPVQGQVPPIQGDRQGYQQAQMQYQAGHAPQGQYQQGNNAPNQQQGQAQKPKVSNG